MLDPKQLKVGSVVRMEGKVARVEGYDIVVLFYGQEAFAISKEAVEKAELISTPVSFSREQIEAIKALPIVAQSRTHFIEWLEAHEDKSRLE